jgi:hypothetical protein
MSPHKVYSFAQFLHLCGVTYAPHTLEDGGYPWHLSLPRGYGSDAQTEWPCLEYAEVLERIREAYERIPENLRATHQGYRK